MSEWFAAAKLENMKENLPYPATVDQDIDVVLIMQGGEVFALHDNCSHQDFPLSQGKVLDGAKLKCRAHGAEFCLKTGKALCAPAFAPVASYKVKVEDGIVYVALD